MVNRHTKPIEIFDMLVRRTFLFDKYHWDKTPGKVITDASPEMRELLKKLKSDDIANIRPDAIFG